MTTTTLYLVGEPGAGKSTLMAELRAGWSELALEKRPMKHVLWDTGRHLVPELGWPRDGFGGTDALPMDAVRHAEQWIATCGYGLVLAEGDRLACSRFFQAAQAAGRLVVGYVHATPELAAARRAERGSDQNAAWLAGRRTKVVNLVDSWSERADQLVWLDASRRPADLAAQLRTEVAELRAVAA